VLSDSSGVVNIQVSVDQSEIDAAIAQIDESFEGKGAAVGGGRGMVMVGWIRISLACLII